MMPNTIPTIIKVRDAALGFFGWVVLANLAFLPIFIIFYMSGPITPITFAQIVLVFWLLPFFAIWILSLAEKTWIIFGVLSAVTTNGVLWMFLNWWTGGDLMFDNIPLPTGLIIFLFIGQ
jgi:hypothetical protein